MLKDVEICLSKIQRRQACIALRLKNYFFKIKYG
jgi:hypothetical protein